MTTRVRYEFLDYQNCAVLQAEGYSFSVPLHWLPQGAEPGVHLRIILSTYSQGVVLRVELDLQDP